MLIMIKYTCILNKTCLIENAAMRYSAAYPMGAERVFRGQELGVRQSV